MKLHSNSHSHSHPNAPATNGLTIRWAKGYDFIFGTFLRTSEGKIMNLAGIKTGDTVLDVGCGPGALSRHAKKQAGQSGKVHGIDAAPEMIEFARQKAAVKGIEVEYHLGVAEALPFADATFDVIISRLVIHHLPGDLKEKAFAEMHRVLKPGGVCLLVDVSPAKKAIMGEIGGLAKCMPLLEQAGFKGIEFGKTGALFLYYVRGQA